METLKDVDAGFASFRAVQRQSMMTPIAGHRVNQEQRHRNSERGADADMENENSTSDAPMNIAASR